MFKTKWFKAYKYKGFQKGINEIMKFIKWFLCFCLIFISINCSGKENVAPKANSQDLTTGQDIAVDVELTANDQEGNPLKFTVVDSPTNGTLMGTAPKFTYKPNQGFVGTDSFTFKANDGKSDSNIAVVNIIILDDLEPNDSFEQAQNIALGETTSSFINPITDLDSYSFSLLTDSIITIQVKAKELNSTLDSFIALFGEDQKMIVQNNDRDANNTDSFIKTVLPAGDYFVVVQDASQVNALNTPSQKLTTLSASKMSYQLEIDQQFPPTVGFARIGENDPSFVKQQDVDVIVKASDDIGIAKVTLFINGVEVASVTEAPYHFSVDFPNVAQATLEVEAEDVDGNKSDRVSHTLTIDSQAPKLNVELFVNSTIVDISQPPIPTIDNTDEVVIVATPNDESSGIDGSKVELKIGAIVIGNLTELGQQSYRLNDIIDFNTTSVVNVSLKAIDGAGNEGDPINFTLSINRDVEPPDKLPTASISVIDIEPEPIDSDRCTLPACYEGTISIPVVVEDETGTAEVTLVVDSEALGKFPVGKISEPPYVFTLDTLDYPNNNKLTLIAQVESTAGRGDDSVPVIIEVLNEVSPPVLSINSPTTGDVVNGIVPVSVTIGQLASSEFTLDLNGDGVVDASVAGAEQEGILIQLIDFTGELVSEQRLSDATINGILEPTKAGSYETREGFNTSEIANDTYTLKASLKMRLQNSPNGQVDDELIRTIFIDTDNSSRVPPSLFILSPTNPVGDVKTIRDPDNTYVSVLSTDNTGLAFIELRVFTGAADDSTPSRFIYASGGETNTSVALPINYNADPFLLDNDNYTVRVVAEDVDGNRTFQDIALNLDRDRPEEELGYALRQTKPFVDVDFTGVAPCLQIVNPVPKNVSFELFTALEFEEVDTPDDCVNTNPVPTITTPTNPGDTFDHLVKLPAESVFRPLSGLAGSTATGYSIAFSEQGNYTFVTQITTEDGSIYLTNKETVTVGN